MNQNRILRNLIQQFECNKHGSHVCPKEQNSDKRCAFCELDFHYLANKPQLLSCSHLICEACNPKDPNEPIICNTHGDTIVVADGTNVSLIINKNIKAFFNNLQNDYQAAMHLHES